jgi:hypothetical protein
MECSPPCQGGGHGFKSRMRRGPLVQWQNPRFSVWRREFDPLVGYGPIVYGLRSRIFAPGYGVRISVGLRRCLLGWASAVNRLHVGSIPTSATYPKL